MPEPAAAAAPAGAPKQEEGGIGKWLKIGQVRWANSVTPSETHTALALLLLLTANFPDMGFDATWLVPKSQYVLWNVLLTIGIVPFSHTILRQ